MSVMRMNGLVGAVLALGIGMSNNAMAEVTLRMANWLPPVHHMQTTIPNWIAEVESATNGEVKIDLMKTPLAPPPGQYDLVKNGIADIAYGVAAFTPGLHPLLRAIEVPFLFENAEAASAGLMEWYLANGFVEQEFDDTVLLAAFTHAPFLYHSAKPLTSLEDLKGLKIRSGGTGIGILQKLGASPSFLNPGQTNEAIRGGTMDATQFPWEGLSGFRLYEVTKHSLVIPGGLYGTAFWVAMSKRSWDQLSPEAQQALMDMRVNGSRVIGQGWDAAEESGKAAAIENGSVITVLSDAETASLKETVAYVEADWVSAADAAGLDGAALMQSLRDSIAGIQ